MRRRFERVDNRDVDDALQVLFERGEVELLGGGFIPEVDFLFCRWHGKRLNVKFDLDYGPELSVLDPYTSEERIELETRIASIGP